MLEIIWKAVAWGLTIGGVFLVAGFFYPLIVGGKGAHQGPLGGIILGAMAFVVGTFVGGLLQWPRARALPAWALAVYGLALALLLYPAYGAAKMGGSIMIKFATVEFPKTDERMTFAPPLTEAERELLKRTHFRLKLAVANPNHPPAYTISLIDDLKATRLFDSVAAAEDVATPGLIATVMGRYYGDKAGQSFTLSTATRPGRAIGVKVHYVLGGMFAGMGDRTQYLERLAVETIRAATELGIEPAGAAK